MTVRMIVLTCTCIVALFLGLNAQQAEDQLKMQMIRSTSVPVAYDEWVLSLSANQLSEELKGWKYIARWYEEEQRHLDASGNPLQLDSWLDAFAQYNQMQSRSSALRHAGMWSPLGPEYAPEPARSWLIPGTGRINTIAFHPTDSLVMWAGGGHNGIWKTVNGGLNWIPLGDNLPVMRVSDIAVNPANPDEIYICLGDFAYLAYWLETADRKRNTHFGLGVYKTTDGGQTWNPTGLTFDLTDNDFSLMRRVFIDSDDDNILLAAGMQGIWKSVDRGETWSQIMTDPIWDIERDPSNDDIIFASTAYISNLNYGKASIIKSTDFGESWATLNSTIPETAEAQRIEIAVSPVNGNYVYAVACNIVGGLYGFYRSTDSGESWELRASSPNILHWQEGLNSGGQGTYDLAILADRYDTEKVYVGGINTWVTEDGGVSWNGAGYYIGYYGPSIHADHHYYAYSPHNDDIYVCHDGGISRTGEIIPGSWVEAKSNPDYEWPTQWEHLNDGLANLAFYRLGVSSFVPGKVFAGAQDMGTFLSDEEGVDWQYKNLGDGMECIISPLTDDVLFGSTQYGNVFHSFDGGETFSSLGGGDRPWLSENAPWTTPYSLDPNDPETVYLPISNVWKSEDSGFSFERISQLSNFPISAFSASRATPQNLYLGKRVWYSLDQPGELFRSSDGGDSWLDITEGTPDSLFITYIETDDEDPDLVWVTFAGFAEGLKVFESRDGGSSWTNISYNLPNFPANCIVQHHGADNNPLYVGMDMGVYYKNDLMDHWELYSEGLPNVIVSEMEVKADDGRLYAATFGRGAWVAALVDQINTATSRSPVIGGSIAIRPNPAHGNATISFSDLQPGEYQLSVIDNMGRIVIQNVVHINSDYQSVPLPELNTSGLYYIRLERGQNLHVTSFVFMN